MVNLSQPGASDVSELSAPCSDVEPETTATAARIQSKKSGSRRTKRSYNTVDPIKRKQLIDMVYKDQKTIKEAANRLRINYSTAKHIIKSKKTEEPTKTTDSDAQKMMTGLSLPAKQQAPLDI